MPRIGFALSLLASAIISGPLAAQSWTLLGGAGGIDYDGSLGPAYHLNARREIASWSDVRLSPGPDGWEIPALHLEADLLAQLGRSGTKVRVCSREEAFCAGGADPLSLLGIGVASKVDLTSPDRAVLLYFLPLSATVFLQSGEIFESRLGSGESTSGWETKVAGGIGNGAGIQLRVAGLIALAEIRAIIVRDLEGKRSGSLPISIGVRW